jgi:hypothetical protein
MAKLPTTFATLDLTGFEIEQKQYTTITREMIDTACAVLQRNRIGVVTRSVSAALKHLYGIGGSADTICKLLNEWRSDNLSALRQGKGEKDLASAILSATDDGLLEEADIPEEYLNVMRQMAVAGYKLAYQKADTSVSGDRMKSLTSENDVMKQQLRDFPQLTLELNFYKGQYERQQGELREAYMSLDKQQLGDSEKFQQQLNLLQAERNELEQKLVISEKQLVTTREMETRAQEQAGNFVLLNGQLEAREREISALHDQIQGLQAIAGEKLVADSQLEQVRSQLRQANETIINLQAQQKSISALEVDVDADALMADKEKLETLLSQYRTELEESEVLVASLKSELVTQSQIESQPQPLALSHSQSKKNRQVASSK